MNRNHYGFTLLEFIIVISIIGVLVSVVPLKARSLHAKQRIQHLATDIEGLLETAKTIAIVENEIVTISFNKVAKNSADNTSEDWEIRANLKNNTGELVGIVEGKNHPEMSIYRTFTKGQFEMNLPNGVPDARGAFVFFADDPQSRVAVVTNNMTGKVYVCSENGEFSYGKCN